MAERSLVSTIDLHLVKVLHTVISERSVSRAAMRLQSTQPMVSAQLKRLRALTGDPLLVRSGQGLAPTDAALAFVTAGFDVFKESFDHPYTHVGLKRFSDAWDATPYQ